MCVFVVRTDRTIRSLVFMHDIGAPDYTLGTPVYTLGTPDYTLGTQVYTLGTPMCTLGTPMYILAPPRLVQKWRVEVEAVLANHLFC